MTSKGGGEYGGSKQNPSTMLRKKGCGEEGNKRREMLLASKCQDSQSILTGFAHTQSLRSGVDKV